jgi:hypothetical protein
MPVMQKGSICAACAHDQSSRCSARSHHIIGYILTMIIGDSTRPAQPRPWLRIAVAAITVAADFTPTTGPRLRGGLDLNRFLARLETAPRRAVSMP